MKCQIQFARKSWKNINLLSAELAQRVIKVSTNHNGSKKKFDFLFIFFFGIF